MIKELDARLEAEAQAFNLAFTCERCAHFEPSRGTCSALYPNDEHREATVRATRRVVFCKAFELA